jgi:hypothetical protein
VRLYLPATVPLLRTWLAAAAATAAGPVYGVTPSLREWYREGDAEELEHAAASLAAAAALHLIAADPAAPPRRAVLAADVAETDCSPVQEERGAVRVPTPIPVADWASALVDDVGAEPAVRAAVGLLRDPGANADDLDFALGEAEATELGWYGLQELPFLLG